MFYCTINSKYMDADTKFQQIQGFQILKIEKLALDKFIEKLRKNSEITRNVNEILTNVESNLIKLEDSIRPVYSKTENLQLVQKNVEKSIDYIDNVIECYKVAEKVESDIRKGPSPISENGSSLAPYLLALDQLAAAQKYFEKYNSQSVELENVNTLLNLGCDNLTREFKGILFKFNKLIAPVELSNLVNLKQDGLEYSTWHQIPGDSINELAQISQCLIKNNRDEFMTIYGKIRSTILQRTLQSLKDHQRSSSLDNSSSLHTSYSSSPIMKSKFLNRHEATRRPSTKRIKQGIEKQANRMFLKATQTLETSTNFFLGSSRRSSFLDISGSSDDLYNEQEMDNYLEYVMAFYKLMKIEQSLMKDIIPSTHEHRVFEIIIRDTMDTIVQDGKNIVSRAKKCISRHDYLSVMLIFPILKQLWQLKPDFDKTIENCDVTVRSKFTTVVDNMYTMSTKILDDFIDNLRTDSTSQLPQDGIVYETTSNVLIFLEQLMEYVEVVGEILCEFYANSINKIKPANRNKAYFGLYMKNVLGQLNITLINRSEQYSDTNLKSIFRLNNNNHILKCLQQNQLALNILKIVEPNCEQNYYKMIEEHKQLYLHGWSKLIAYITVEEEVKFSSHGHKLKEKDRNLFKEKFSGFNKEIEEIARIQRRYSIPDVELRESIKRDNKEHILPKYNAFYESYSNLPFTKNPDKYIKYTPAQISAMIDRFFDVAA